MLKAMSPSVDREEAIVSIPADRKITRNFGRDTELDVSSPELEYREHMMPTERLFDSITWMLGYISYWNSSDVSHPMNDATQFFESFNSSILKSFSDYPIASHKVGQRHGQGSGLHSF